MFNKKLFIFAIVLLFILQISFVNAQEDNDTEVINQTMDCPKFYNNGTLQNNANSSIKFYTFVCFLNKCTNSSGLLLHFCYK